MADIPQEAHKKLGAVHHSAEGSGPPDSYGDPAGEMTAVQEGAGVVDRSPRARLVISGADRASFLERLVSNSVTRLSEGQGTAAALLTPKGKLISDMVIYHLGDRFLLDLPAGARETLVRKLTMYVLSSDVTVSDATDDRGLLGVHGPDAAAKLGSLVTGDLPEELFDARELELAGRPVVLCRVDYLGVVGFDVHLPARETAAVLEILVEAGVQPVGREAQEAVRIDAGIPRFGAELTEELLLPEIPALVDRMISYTKGCFVGQETIGRLKSHGHVNRELRKLAFLDGQAPPPGSRLYLESRKVGGVTSSCVLPASGEAIGLGFVHRKYLDSGVELEVEMEDGRNLRARIR